ncbi:hypothetical protein DFJ77DRAFT_545666 [Powellomyces hirtus]|nr:hypothetical protein DFJ77DRAFT_545666 [Powellomyces hirtus]
MSVVKRLLKSAREEIGKKDFELAKDYCQQILDIEEENYNALVFLGLAEQHLNHPTDSEKAYSRAVKLSPSNPLALQGLANLYTQGNDESLARTWEALCDLYNESKDGAKVLDLINKLTELFEKNGQLFKAVNVLKALAPGGKYHDVCSTLALPPLELWRRIAALQEKHNETTQAKEVEARRRRLGADTVDVIREKVEREVLLASELDSTYEQILLSIDEDSADMALKYLEYLDRKILYVELEERSKIHTRMVSLAESLHSQNVKSPVALDVLLNSQDVSIGDYDVDLLTTVRDASCGSISDFADAYLKWRLDGDRAGALTELRADPAKHATSFIAQWLLGEIYLDLRDYTSAATVFSRAVHLNTLYSERTGHQRVAVTASLNLSLARAYHMAGTRTLPEALSLYKAVVQQNFKSDEGLLGLGSVLRDMGKFDEAIRCLEKLVPTERFSHAAKSELGWVHFKKGEYQQAIDLLQDAVDKKADATNLFRLGRAYWAWNGTYRSNKQYCHAAWLRAAKLDPDNAPVFAFLGHFYAEVEKDQVRAIRCYTRATSIDPGNEDAARALSTIWLENNERASAENVLNAYLARQPRSSWGWRLLGSLSLVNENNVAAISHLQAALRIDPKDTRCWEALGEAYTLEGKFAAALKAYGRAIDHEPDSASLYYQVGILKQKLGLFGDAIESFRHALSLTATAANSNNRHLPTIQGLCASQLSEAKRLFEEGAHGQCAQLLGEALEYTVQALKENKIHSFAKILGDICLAYRTLVPAHAERVDKSAIQGALVVLNSVVEIPESDPELSADAKTYESLDLILCCSTTAYKVALSLCGPVKSDNIATVAAGYWNDLGLAYFYRSESRFLDDDASKALKKKLSDHAIACAKMAIQKEPRSELYWNALAVYHLRTNARLSQHALIKAIEINPSSAPLWTNLGFLYLREKDLDLAQQAFSRAQFVDPEWGLGWLGHGLVAEGSGKDALEYFEQAFDLGTHIALEINYAYPRALHRHAVVSGQSTPGTASLCLYKYTQQRPLDWAALNLLGLCLEREKQYGRAAESFTKALRALDLTTVPAEGKASHCHNITENLARVLCSAGHYAQATECYGLLASLGAGDTYTHLSNGLALSFEGRLQEGLAVFEKALETAASAPASEDATKVALLNDVTFTLAQVLYALASEQHQDLAKQQLLACITRTPQHIKALMALCAFGLVRQDGNLAQSAAAQILKLTPEALGDHDADADRLLSALFAIQGNMAAAKGFISKSLHRSPWKAERWQRLAEFLYQRSPDGTAALTTAESALRLTFAGAESTDLRANVLITSGMAELAVGSLRTRSMRRSARSRKYCIQKAVRTSPSDPAAWMALGIQTRSELASVTTGSELKSDTSRKLNHISKRVGEATAAVAGSKQKQMQSGSYVSTKQKNRASTAMGWANLLIADSLVVEAQLSQAEKPDVERVRTASALVSSVLELKDPLLHGYAYNVLGRGLRVAGDIQGAAQAFKQALALGFGFEDLAALYKTLGLDRASEMCLRHALTAKSYVHARQKSPVLLRLAMLAFSEANMALVNEAVNEGLKLNPGSTAGRCLQALTNARARDHAKALKILRSLPADPYVAEMIEIVSK